MFIRLEPGSGLPIKRQIADQVRLLCATGALRPGDRMPSVRQLAQEIAVNQNTVLRVYEQLTTEGLLERRHGDGTYIANGKHTDLRGKQMAILRQELARVAHRATELDIPRTELKKLLDEVIAEQRSVS